MNPGTNVVERGLARCPRCVAVADYVFVEITGETGGPGPMRYEVHCRRCGQCYREAYGPTAPTFTAVDVPVPLAPPAIDENPHPNRIAGRLRGEWHRAAGRVRRVATLHTVRRVPAERVAEGEPVS